MSSFDPDNRPILPAPTDDNDPFVSTGTPSTASHHHQHHHRYANFDHDLFAAGPGSSPRQAKRALEAHLAETERRLDEAGKLGTALVSQRKALTEQLEEVEKLQGEGEMNPELRKKLVDIEKEYNDLARESARAFLPKQRVPSNEANPGSPYVPEGRSGRRSVSPSKFESQATGSPTKLSVPNRKVRNQPSNRNHDIEFAAEISQSLIVQVRNLQALLAERDEEVRDLKNDKSSLEIESESLQQRLKALDESEHRYKEENWNLETRLQELSSQQRDAVDREKKLTHSLNLANTDKLAVQNKLDEVKLSHARLLEEHAASVKHTDIELGTAKRNMIQAEGERTAMQRRIEDLTNQNQELAKAFSQQQRGRTLERESVSGQSEDDHEAATDQATPEHSPPPSPIKGTPRHSMLETETMKTSLHHAQRTIQSQRNLIHREKTEKLELRRMIQDLRDDLERTRNEASSGTTSSRRSRKVDAKDLKKSSSRLLGSFRSSRQEILPDDPEWEDNQDINQQQSPRLGSSRVSRIPDIPTDTTDHFETANEASESAFETANERATETEDFQTTNEAFSGSDDAETETESTSRGFGRMRPPPILSAGSHSRHQQQQHHLPSEAFDSTASTSADEDDLDLIEAKTPTASIASQRNRFRLSRGPFGRNSRQASEEPSFKSSPAASFVSSNGDTPQGGQHLLQQHQQSLFAELGDFGGSDDESVGNGTPSRRSVRSVTPGSTRRPYSPPPAMPAMPKVIMVDSGVMTEPVDIREDAADADPTLTNLSPAVLSPESDRPRSMQSVVAAGDSNRDSAFWPSTSSRPLSTMSYSDAGSQMDPDMGAQLLAQFPVPPSMVVAPPVLSVSGIHAEALEPQEVETPQPSLAYTTIAAENVDPIAEPEVPQPVFSLLMVGGENLEPIAEPETPRPVFSLNMVGAENLEPIAEPEIIPSLGYTPINTEQVDPIAEPEVPRPVLGYITINTEKVDPIAEPETPRPVLSLSTVGGEDLEPVEEPEIPLPPLSISQITSEDLSPILEPEIPPPALSIATIGSQHWEPLAEPEIPPPALTIISLQSEAVEPVEVPEPVPAALALTSLYSEAVDPVEEPEVPQPALSLSQVVGEEVEPVAEPEPEPHSTLAPIPVPLPLDMSADKDIEDVKEEPVTLSMTSIVTEKVEPIQEPEVVIPRPQLGVSAVYSEHLQPVAEPEPVPTPLSYATIGTENWEPISAPEPVPATLGYSSIIKENLEPVSEPEPVRAILGYAPIGHQHWEPVSEPEPVPTPLSYAAIGTQNWEPVSEPEPVPATLGYSSIIKENLEPVAEPEPVPATLGYTSIIKENVEPVAEPEPTLGFSSITKENVEPIAVPEPVLAALGYSLVNGQNVEPVPEPSPKLALSSVGAESVSPVAEKPPTFGYSLLAAETVQPASPLEMESLPMFGFAPIASIDTEPITPRSPKRDAFIMPRDRDELETPTRRPVPTLFLGNGGVSSDDAPVVIAEDETRQSPRDVEDNEPWSSQQQPLRELSNNAGGRHGDKSLTMSDQGAQTSLTADVLDELFRSTSSGSHVSPPSAPLSRDGGHFKSMSVSSIGSPGTTGTVRIHRRDTDERTGSPSPSGRRPGSAGSVSSVKTTIHDAAPPPLPTNHRELIEAARTGSASGVSVSGTSQSMPPPAWPASALRNRPLTPRENASVTAATPRAMIRNSTTNSRPMSPGRLTARSSRSRQSSVSSFASEIDARFGMRQGEMAMHPADPGSASDPRMIQAITQTMIGEYLWKYTRKTGRGDMSEKRHRRYFWLHPYTRTLYWSDGDPTSAGRHELKAKSVPVEAVRVVTDDNPMPPGLHRKSLIVIAPGRSVKFTCTTGQRHETWFNALSYLLMRSNNNQDGDSPTATANATQNVTDLAHNITQDDVDEFNPQFGQRNRTARGPAGTGAGGPPSLSSYNSRTTRNQSPPDDMMSIPTLTPTNRHGAAQSQSQANRPGTLSKMSGYFRSSSSRLSGNLGSLRGRGASGQHSQQSIYEASEVHDSAEDLRLMIEQQDRESDRLENVRACCDGKHDVGTLHHLASKRGRTHHHTHTHTPGPSATPTPMASMRSRA